MKKKIDSSKSLLYRRRNVFGTSALLFYDKPVYLTQASGVWMYDDNGTDYLDSYNNVCSVGHCNQEVVEAISKQVAKLNTHTRYLYNEIYDYSEMLLAEFEKHLNKVSFTCTGSESNDLAMRIAMEWTGADGFVIIENAYHGGSVATNQISPYKNKSCSRNVRYIKAPDTLRLSENDIITNFTDGLRNAILSLEQEGYPFAAFIVDCSYETNGILPHPTNYLQAAEKIVHESAGLFIADEVQAGFARMGDTMWGYQRHGVKPDMITLGKPMANGLPMGAVICTTEHLDHFFSKNEYFNTFAGNPVCAAAGAATLKFIKKEELLTHSRKLGNKLKIEMKYLMNRYDIIGDIRGSGLFLGVEMVTERKSNTPATKLASQIMNKMRERRVLTGLTGKHANVLKIRPPLVINDSCIDQIVTTLEQVLEKDI